MPETSKLLKPIKDPVLEKYRLLIINPGSTSTKIAIFENETEMIKLVIEHSKEELAPYDTIIDQLEFRKDVVLDALHAEKIDMSQIDAIVGRGGLLRPMEGGTYKINRKMVDDSRETASSQHASTLGTLIAHEIARQLDVPAFIVDPIVVDEYEDISRISGMPEIERKSLTHALNQKAVGRRAAKELGKRYEDVNLLVVHMGGGISVVAHQKGRMVDSNNGLDGDGPFSPERSGGVPVGALVELCHSGRYTLGEIRKKILGQGGLTAYLGTNDGREINKRIASGDKYAELIYKAMAYQVAKEIGAYVTVLDGNVDLICITGGLAYDEILMGWIKEKVRYLGEVRIYPGEDEIRSLAEGGLRVLRGEEKEKEYR